jgi:hypothetical protein
MVPCIYSSFLCFTAPSFSVACIPLPSITLFPPSEAPFITVIYITLPSVAVLSGPQYRTALSYVVRVHFPTPIRWTTAFAPLRLCREALFKFHRIELFYPFTSICRFTPYLFSCHWLYGWPVCPSDRDIFNFNFGSKRDEVIGSGRKLHNEELHHLYVSPSMIRIIKSRRMRWAGYVAWMGEKRNAYRILVGKPERKRLLGRPRR